MSEIERVPTGIKGFDDLVGGGFPRGSIILVAGVAGAGKSIFGMQYLYYGAEFCGEPGILIVVEESAQSHRETARLLGMNFSRLEEEGKVVILDIGAIRKKIGMEESTIPGLWDIAEIVEKLTKKLSAKRLVIDSLTALTFKYESLAKMRIDMFRLFSKLKALGLTSLVLTELEEGKPSISRYGMEDFLVDGIVILGRERVGSHYRRWIAVPKMRHTKHSLELVLMDITDEGIVVYKEAPMV